MFVTGNIEVLMNNEESIHQIVDRTIIINSLVEAYEYSSYLEIGVRNPYSNFYLIKCEKKIGIDPVPLKPDIVKSTSDDFFANLSAGIKFDIIFIDGLHHADQVQRDIENALLHLNINGTIVCHDLLPTTEAMQIAPYQKEQLKEWTGDCWKAWAYLRMTNPRVKMTVINTDYGVGILNIGKQDLYLPAVSIDDMSYDFFCRNKRELMNILEINEYFDLSS